MVFFLAMVRFWFTCLHLSSSCARWKRRNHPFSCLLLSSSIPRATTSLIFEMRLSSVSATPIQSLCSSQCKVIVLQQKHAHVQHLLEAVSGLEQPEPAVQGAGQGMGRWTGARCSLEHWTMEDLECCAQVHRAWIWKGYLKSWQAIEGF